MSRIWFGVLLILFGILFLLNSLDLIKSDFYLEFLNLAQKYWPVLLILFGLQLTFKDHNPDLARVIRWLLLLLIGFWIFCMVFAERKWII